MTLSITGDFDGGNPRASDSIIQTSQDAFTIFPYSEDGDPNYKFRLEVKVRNPSSKKQKLKLKIEWQDITYQYLRDYVYAKHEKDKNWQYISGDVHNGSTTLHLKVLPGNTYISMHPKYGYNDYLKLVRSIGVNRTIKKEMIGKTAEGRELWLLRIGDHKIQSRKRALLAARVHPYETAGSYCMEGIINYFSNHESPLTFDLSPFTVFLNPMANPDGVFNGLCKKTSVDGIDLAKEIEPSDVTWRVLREAMDSVRPDIYCEIHNWMHKDVDGIYFMNWRHVRRFTSAIPSQERHGKRWKVFLRKKFFSMKPHGFKLYCKEKFGSVCASLEYPWFSRSIEDMRNLGVSTLLALTKI